MIFKLTKKDTLKAVFLQNEVIISQNQLLLTKYENNPIKNCEANKKHLIKKITEYNKFLESKGVKQ